MTTLDPSSTRADGLTLLEVLAAFLIFSLVFTVLVGSSQSAVQSQGISMRRLAANEVADLVVADLEIPMARHELPIIEEDEYPIEEFMVRIYERDLLGEDQNQQQDQPVGADAGLGIVGFGVEALLGTQLPDVAKYLKRYDIQVEWIEGNGSHTVDRTTFAFDWASAQLDSSGLFGAASSSGSDPSTSDDPDAAEADGESGGADDRSRSREKSGGGSKTEAEKILEQMRPYL